VEEVMDTDRLVQPDQARVVRPIGAGTEFRPATNVNLAEEVASADEGEDEAIIVGMRRCDDSDDGCEELVYWPSYDNAKEQCTYQKVELSLEPSFLLKKWCFYTTGSTSTNKWKIQKQVIAMAVVYVMSQLLKIVPL
jgi:hypothetical protein